MNLSKDQLHILASDPSDTISPTVVATTILLVVIALMGIIGNGLVLWAFRCQVSQCVVSSLLILLLACLDMIICSIGIPATLYLDVWHGEATEFLCRAHLAFKGFIVPVSASLLVLIALERFLLICFIPSIGLKRAHLIAAFTIILLIGVILAVPMSLHVHAVKVVKSHDVLFQPVPFEDEKTVPGALHLPEDVHVPVRCNKDDTFISDTAYWYYQIVVISLFSALFLATALLYAVVFLFVWRHESLMFERYGKSKYRGYFIRIHESIRRPQKKNGKCKCSETSRDRQTMGNVETGPGDKILDARQPSTLSGARIDGCGGDFGANAFEASGSFGCACHCSTRDDPTQTSSSEHHFDVHSKEVVQKDVTNIPEEEDNATSVPHQHSSAIPRSGHLQATLKRKHLCSCFTKAGTQLRGNQNDSLSVYNPMVAEPVTEQTQSQRQLLPMTVECQQRTVKAAKSMERRRKPHVYTAKNFAMIAAAFIISYTPYLVYTAMPVSKRSLMPNAETSLWSSIGQVLFYLYFANSAANPIIYSCMNRHFRSFLSKQFCRKKHGVRSQKERNSKAPVVSYDSRVPKNEGPNDKLENSTVEAS
ncbi:unnamed protein product [Echinostoma caproni]|uniref:G_PROTEIN_RECEP_F1_2 domain-containing protein n=1 Tax=Echinostoma caproni TaxID=27848 RepID=A0A183A5Z4_9TREM|nr:unnamed protein product [Echinostoma caproni]